MRDSNISPSSSKTLEHAVLGLDKKVDTFKDETTVALSSLTQLITLFKPPVPFCYCFSSPMPPCHLQDESQHTEQTRLFSSSIGKQYSPTMSCASTQTSPTDSAPLSTTSSDSKKSTNLTRNSPSLATSPSQELFKSISLLDPPPKQRKRPGSPLALSKSFVQKHAVQRKTNQKTSK